MKRALAVASMVAVLTAVAWVARTTAQGQELELFRTKAIDGVYIGVASSGFTTNETPVDNALVFGVWRTTTNYHNTVYIPAEPEYAFRVELFDTNGVAMPKTELGRRVGTKFMDLDTTFSNAGPRLAIVRPADEPGYTGQYLFFPQKSGYGGGPFYSPSDLFEIKSPGRYTL
jgi:hypothetical protein